MRNRINVMLIALAATAFLAAPRISLAGPKISGSMTGQFVDVMHNNANASKIQEYGALPEDFTLSGFDALYKSNRIRMGFYLANPGDESAEGAFCFHEYKDRIAFEASEIKTPHFMGMLGSTPVETERNKFRYAVKLYPNQKNRLSAAYTVEDKVGRFDVSPSDERALGLYSFNPVGQKDRRLDGEWAGTAMGVLFNVGATGRKFYHNSFAGEEMGVDLNVRSNPVKKHYAEAAYSFNKLSPEANNAGSKLEFSNLDLSFVGAVSNRLSFDTSIAIDDRTNDNTTSGYGEKRTSFLLGSDYSAGSLDVNLSYDNTSRDKTNSGVFDTVSTDYSYVSARTLDSETLGLGLDYRYSIFKLKYDYKNTHYDTDALATGLLDINFANMPGESRKRNIVISTRGLKNFGFTTYRKDTNIKRSAGAFGSDYNKTRTSGAASYWNYSDTTTFTLDVFNMQWGSRAVTSNRGTTLNMGLYQSTRIVNLGAAFVIDAKNTFSAGIGRTNAKFNNRFVDNLGAVTEINNNNLWCRSVSLSFAHQFDSRTSLEASFIGNRYDETVYSPFDGNTRILSVKATRKF